MYMFIIIRNIIVLKIEKKMGLMFCLQFMIKECIKIFLLEE